MAPGDLQQSIFSISGLGDVVLARRYGLNRAMELGFHLAEATKIAVVISELGRNIERYAGTGTITITSHPGADTYIRVIAEDHGPGFADIKRVMAGGYTTSKGMGLGISGSKKLMDEFDIQSTVGKGTTVTAVKRLRVK